MSSATHEPARGSGAPGAGRPPASRGGAPFLARWVATLSFVGHFPFAPATAASLVVALLLYMAPPPPFLHAVLVAVLLLAGVRAAGLAERAYGEDGGEIVVDEAVGMGIALFLAPHRPEVYLAAFLLFRLFDIVKPWPIRRLEDLPGGWGIMADDALAGLYALVLLHAGLGLLPGAR